MWLPLWGVLGLALALRLAWAAVIGVVPVSDGYAYHQLAQTLVEHGVYGLSPEAPRAYRPVGTSAIYAAAYWLFGIGGFAVVVANLMSSLAIVAGTDWFGRRVFGAAVGRLAALMVACWPTLIQFTTIPASELHFLAAMLGAIWAWDKANAPETSGLRWVLLCAGFLVVATYIKPIALLLPVVFCGVAVLQGQARLLLCGLRGAVIMALVLLSLTPWTLRNERVTGAPFMTASNFWPNVWIGNHTGASGSYADLPPEVAEMDEVTLALTLRDWVLTDIREEPAVFVLGLLRKAVLFHKWETIGVYWNGPEIHHHLGAVGFDILRLGSALWWVGVMGLASAGTAMLLRQEGLRRSLGRLPVALWVYFLAVHVPFLVDDRLHMPIVPGLAVLGAYALIHWRVILSGTEHAETAHPSARAFASATVTARASASVTARASATVTARASARASANATALATAIAPRSIRAGTPTANGDRIDGWGHPSASEPAACFLTVGRQRFPMIWTATWRLSGRDRRGLPWPWNWRGRGSISF